MNLAEKALEIATKAHEGQFRRDGKTKYITHPIAVSEIVSKWFNSYFGWLEGNTENSEIMNIDFFSISKFYNLSKLDFLEVLKSVSLLHDALEDNSENHGYLYELAQTFGNNKLIDIIVETVSILTHDENDSYLDYILKVKENKIATIVKLADISHNISTRTGANTAGDKKRDKIAIDKYKLAEYILLN